MNSLKRALLGIVCMVLLAAALGAGIQAYGAENFSAKAIQNKAAAKYEESIRATLATFFQQSSYLLTVKVTLDDEKMKNARAVVESAKNDMELTRLPDLPVSFGERDYGKLVTDTLSADELDQYVQSVSVRLIVDQNIPEKAVALLGSTVKDVLDPDNKRKDAIQVDRAPLHAPTAAELSRAEMDSSAKGQVLRLVSDYQNLLAMGILSLCLMAGLMFLGRSLGRGGLAAPAPAAAADSPSAPPMNAPAIVAPPPYPGAAPAVIPATRSGERGLHSRIAKVARERPDHLASAFRSFMGDARQREAVVLCLQNLPLETARAVVACLSPREAAQLMNRMGEPGMDATSDEAVAMLKNLHDSVLAQELSPDSVDWDFLGLLTDEEISQLIESQDTDGKALVIFHLPSVRAAGFYGKLGAGDQAEVISAMFALEERAAGDMKPALERLREQAKQMAKRAPSAISDATGWVTSVGPRLSADHRGALVAGTDSVRRPLVQAKLFSFNDASVLPDGILGPILQAFNPAELATLIASIDAGSELARRCMGSLPAQVREIVEDESAAKRQAASAPLNARRLKSEAGRLRIRFEQIVKTMDAKDEISLVQLFSDAAPQAAAGVGFSANDSMDEEDTDIRQAA